MQVQSLRSFDDDTTPSEGAQSRRLFVEQQTGVSLDVIAHHQVKPDVVVGKNIENLVGEVSVPLGVAGPLKVQGTAAHGEYYLPCATTEGALTASISRGCKVISQSGGATVLVEYDGITRAPLFEARDAKSAGEFAPFLEKHFDALADIAATTSTHIRLLNAEATQLGKYVWVRLSFDTQQAMGMNMASTAAEKIAAYITEHLAASRLVALSGNLCVDKKSNWLNVTKGRGYRTTVECVIPDRVLQDVLHTSAKDMADVCRTKNWYGSGLSGSSGFNAQAANVVAAVFLATGQDMAHVAESSQAFTIAEEVQGGLYVSVTLPNIICGSVGGGTGLDGQRAALSLMTHAIDQTDEATDNEVYQFVEVLSAGVLAGELSLLAALCTNTLASAHRKLTGKE